MFIVGMFISWYGTLSLDGEKKDSANPIAAKERISLFFIVWMLSPPHVKVCVVICVLVLLLLRIFFISISLFMFN